MEKKHSKSESTVRPTFSNIQKNAKPVQLSNSF